MVSRILIICGVFLMLGACASTDSKMPASTEVSKQSTHASNVAENPATQPLTEPQVVDVSDVDAQVARKHRLVAGGKDPNEMICKREMESGSRFMVKNCKTRAEWEERSTNDQEILELVDRKRMCGGNGCR